MVYPVTKTVAVSNVTPIQAIHLNNLEDKVGIDSDPNPVSLDYRVGMMEVDHDPADGSHRLGVWKIGAVPVTASGTEVNQALDGISANVTFTNLNSLTGGADIGATLHQHALYAGVVNSSLMNAGGPVPNLNPGSTGWAQGFICFYFDTASTIIPSRGTAYPVNTLHMLATARGTLTNLRVRVTISGGVFDTVMQDQWNANSAGISAFSYTPVGDYTYPLQPTGGTDRFYWGGQPGYLGPGGDNHNFEAEYSSTGSGDALHVSVTGGPSATTQITAEVVDQGGNQGFHLILLGSMVGSYGFGNIGQKVIFTLGGKLVQII
jgi:hypothetical protein